MLQPFQLFKLPYINRLINLKKTYLVTQSYTRAHNIFTDAKKSLLLTDYDDLGLAKIHLNAVKIDKYAAIIDLNRLEHRMKLQEMLAPPSAYIIYWSVVKDAAALQKSINIAYKDKMKKYIEQRTNWRIDRELTITPKVEVTFGELYITIKHARQQLRIKFEEIENL